MRLALPIPLSIVAITLLVTLPSSSVHAVPSPEPSSVTEAEQQQQKTSSTVASSPEIISSTLASSSAFAPNEVSVTLQQSTDGSQTIQATPANPAAQPAPPLPKLASPLDVLSYAPAANTELHHQLLQDKLRMRPLEHLPLMPGIQWPGTTTTGHPGVPLTPEQRQALRQSSGAAYGHKRMLGHDAATEAHAHLEEEMDVHPAGAASVGAKSGIEGEDGHDVETEKRATGAAPSSSPPPNVDPEMTCYLDFDKPGVVLCSNGKTYAYHNPAMGSSGAGTSGGGAQQMMPPRPFLVKRTIYTTGVEHGTPGQPILPGPISSHGIHPAGPIFPMSSGYSRTGSSHYASQPQRPHQQQQQQWIPATAGDTLYKRGEWGSKPSWGKDKPKHHPDWKHKGGGKDWHKRTLETDQVASGAPLSSSPMMMYYAPPTAAAAATVPSTGYPTGQLTGYPAGYLVGQSTTAAGGSAGSGSAATTTASTLTANDLIHLLAQQHQQQLQHQQHQQNLQYQQSLQQQQLALQQQQQAALIRSQLLQNLIATQPEGVVSSASTSSDQATATTTTPHRYQKRQNPALAAATMGGVGPGLTGLPGSPPAAGPKVIPVPIDISLLTSPDGDLTLLPPDFDPARFTGASGGFSKGPYAGPFGY